MKMRRAKKGGLGRPFKAGAANPGHKTQRPVTGAGRAKGTPNKVTRDVKEMVVNALLALGGEDWLEKLGRGKYKNSFATLLGKTMPLQMIGDGESDPDKLAARVRDRLAAIEGVTTQVTEPQPKEKRKS